MTDLFATMVRDFFNEKPAITSADFVAAASKKAGKVDMAQHLSQSGKEGGEVSQGEPAAHIPRARTHLACNVNVLALDLGGYCGWATANRDGALEYGTERFMQRNKWHPGERWSNFRLWLANQIVLRQIEVVYFEDVKAHGPGQVVSAHIYGGYLAMTQMVCAQHNVRMVGVGVGTVKKAWTGKGNAKKPEMIAAAQAKGFRVANDEDDTADALAILAYGVQQEA